jgi:Protein of unknown function (DUF3305)
MQEDTLRVGVLIEKRRSMSLWAEFSWHVVGADTNPPVNTWTEIRRSERGTAYLTSADVEVHKSDTLGYSENLNSGAPKLWVVFRPNDDDTECELVLVTADPAEGEAMTQNGDLLVEAVAMPDAMRLWLEAFVREHHVEHAFYKRKRDERPL